MKHQQIVSGVRLAAYWAANYAFDLIFFFVPLLGTLVLTNAFGMTGLSGTTGTLPLAVVLLLFGAAVLPWSYTISYFFDVHTTAQTAVTLTQSILSIVLFAGWTVLEALSANNTVPSWAADLCSYVSSPSVYY